MTNACPACTSADTRYRDKRGDCVCDACENAWAGTAPTAEDALIVEAAGVAGATRVLSEDLADGQDFDGVGITSPFRSRPEA